MKEVVKGQSDRMDGLAAPASLQDSQEIGWADGRPCSLLEVEKGAAKGQPDRTDGLAAPVPLQDSQEIGWADGRPCSRLDPLDEVEAVGNESGAAEGFGSFGRARPRPAEIITAAEEETDGSNSGPGTSLSPVEESRTLGGRMSSPGVDEIQREEEFDHAFSGIQPVAAAVGDGEGEDEGNPDREEQIDWLAFLDDQACLHSRRHRAAASGVSC
eukprot:2008306-Rhodomonas_salina.1